MSESDGHKETMEIVEARKRAYQLTFGSQHGQMVLMDLIQFCRGLESPAIPGERDKTFMLLGRQEVFLRVQQHTQLLPEHLFRLFTGRTYNPGGEENDGHQPGG